MCKKCIHIELLIKSFFQELKYNTKAINRYFVSNYNIKCVQINKNYVRNYIIYNLDQLTFSYKEKVLTYIDNV